MIDPVAKEDVLYAYCFYPIEKNKPIVEQLAETASYCQSEDPIKENYQPPTLTS